MANLPQKETKRTIGNGREWPLIQEAFVHDIFTDERSRGEVWVKKVFMRKNITKGPVL